MSDDFVEGLEAMERAGGQWYSTAMRALLAHLSLSGFKPLAAWFGGPDPGDPCTHIYPNGELSTVGRCVFDAKGARVRNGDGYDVVSGGHPSEVIRLVEEALAGAPTK